MRAVGNDSLVSFKKFFFSDVPHALRKYRKKGARLLMKLIVPVPI